MATLTANPWVRLGRVSNLPTVWSNSLAAAVLSGVQPTWLEVTASALILSTFYVSGMILNDAFDVEYDAVHRPARPIPAGQVSRSAAFGAGFGGLCVGLLAMVAVAAPAARWGAGVWGMALATCIVVYDRHHKQNPFSPVLMGACRAVAIGAVCWIHAGQLTSGVVVAALLQWSYVVGLTYAAKQEDLKRVGSLWPVALVFSGALWFVAALGGWEPSWSSASGPLLPVESTARVPTAIALGLFVAAAARGVAPLLGRPRRIGLGVGRMIAAIALLDAVCLAAAGSVMGCALAVGCAVATAAGQRWVPGT